MSVRNETMDRATQGRVVAHERGYKAHGDGTPFSGNPYSMSQAPNYRKAWSTGWEEAEQHARDLAEQKATELIDAVRNAAHDIPDGPMRRFADAVVEWIEENGK